MAKGEQGFGSLAHLRRGRALPEDGEHSLTAAGSADAFLWMIPRP